MSEPIYDDYGNEITEDGEYAQIPFKYCAFPDCGCDGSRLCVATEGASERACRQNLEGMYERINRKAAAARMSLAADVERERQQRTPTESQRETDKP